MLSAGGPNSSSQRSDNGQLLGGREKGGSVRKGKKAIIGVAKPPRIPQGKRS